MNERDFAALIQRHMGLTPTQSDEYAEAVRLCRAVAELPAPGEPVSAGDLIAAGEKYAATYDGDDRQDVKTDVLNAFYQGAHWALKAAPAPSERQPDLHGAIMNLPVGQSFNDHYRNPSTCQAYKDGHRDARHAAAELVVINRA